MASALASVAGTLLFPRPASTYMFWMECFMWVEAFTAIVNAKKTYYSKFASLASDKGLQLPGRIGFLFIYSPSALAALVFLGSKLGFLTAPALFLHGIGLKTFASALQPQEDTSLRIWLLAAAFAIHFWKRVLEVAFLHDFSNRADVVTISVIGLHYLSTMIHVLVAECLTSRLPSPRLDLTRMGVVLFVVGITGNFYHHVLLKGLRSKKGGKGKDGKEQKYLVPHGGLFEWVACPHYAFELIEFWGLAMVAQTQMALASAINTTLYLGTRSRMTHEWYLQKLEDFPKDRTSLVPYLF